MARHGTEAGFSPQAMCQILMKKPQVPHPQFPHEMMT